jgi:hypothetical protein
MLAERPRDGASPFEDHECGHLPCPPWIEDGEGAPESVAVAQHEESELDAPHHVHDLWAVLGLGEE